MKIPTTLFLLVVVGFSIGDELGFRDSLSNLESSKRRSVQVGRGNAVPVGSPIVANRNDPRQIPQSTRVVPPFKPLPPGAARPMAQQPERQRLVVQQNLTALKTMPAPSLVAMQEEAFRQHQRLQQEEKMRLQQHQQLQQQHQLLQHQQIQQQQLQQQQQQRLQQEALAMQVLKQQQMQQQEAMRQQQMQKLAQQQQAAMRVQGLAPATSGRLPNIIMAVGPGNNAVAQNVVAQVPKPGSGVVAGENGLPPFVAMPKSSAQLTDRISNSPTLLEDSVNEVPKDDSSQSLMPSDEAVSTVNQLTLRSVQPMANSLQSIQSIQQQVSQQQFQKLQPAIPSLPSLEPIHGMETSLKALADASNITLEALETAILLRQQQLMQKQQGPTTTTTTTTTTTHAPIKSKNNYAGATKVMNAPREYYPVGYDKNFDDNFASRVDLPETSFYCGDQKHFPGLYADEDLGCMVFHVCALTDDGLIMKSFLCPESTLFDQTILKCNWWFYVDCKTSKSLYDSNIPISKSYQLMKALAFFSAYKNHDNGTAEATKSDKS
ncbi:bromodomain-containing protein DDB_G0280777 isoform X2 [Orussus abietinus]|uniref:bromodomain-containing protein DDB_G0280777 isoform X2 n=1 Tax=Orussus abietinus TaxID=222816 RepID=UPI0006266B7B|nr:bromodomain-containing protein DDB_G0280777 isoform X2 [Orussus abietinus]